MKRAQKELRLDLAEYDVVTLTIPGARITISPRVRRPRDDDRVPPRHTLALITVRPQFGVRTLKCWHNHITLIIPPDLGADADAEVRAAEDAIEAGQARWSETGSSRKP